jgi:hypothetical protein
MKSSVGRAILTTLDSAKQCRFMMCSNSKPLYFNGSKIQRISYEKSCLTETGFAEMTLRRLPVDVTPILKLPRIRLLGIHGTFPDSALYVQVRFSRDLSHDRHARIEFALRASATRRTTPARIGSSGLLCDSLTVIYKAYNCADNHYSRVHIS